MYTNCQSYCCSSTGNCCGYLTGEPSYCCMPIIQTETRKLSQQTPISLRKVPPIDPLAKKTKKKTGKPKKECMDGQPIDCPKSKVSCTSLRLSRTCSNLKLVCTCKNHDQNMDKKQANKSRSTGSNLKCNDFVQEQKEFYHNIMESKRGSGITGAPGYVRSSKQYNNAIRNSANKRQCVFPEDKGKQAEICCGCQNKCCPINPPPQVLCVKPSKQVFDCSKSCPQLDAIAEEDIEMESMNCLNNSHKSRQNKALEDSCADFLSIVCDNILESVQKSVDCKLSELNSQAANTLNGLICKMESNETLIQKMFTKLMDKMADQNKKNFNEMCCMLTDMTANLKKTISENAAKPEKRYNTNPCIMPEVVLSCECINQDTDADNIEKEVLCCCALPDENRAIQNICEDHTRSPLQYDDSCYAINDNCGGYQVQKVGGCNFQTDNNYHPAAMKNVESIHFDIISCGGGGKESGWDGKRKYKTALEKCPGANESLDIRSQTLRVNSVGPAPRTEFNCPCCCERHMGGETQIIEKRTSRIIINNDKKNGQNINDYYDTSGYASEPEDNNDDAVKSGRKKLQKKTSKQPIALEVVNNTNRQDNSSDVINNQIKKKPIKKRSKSCNSSPTRLTRL